MKTNWKNPWDDAIPVPLEELSECVYGIGQSCGSKDGSFIMTAEHMLNHWKERSKKLDAYILPQSDGRHCIGVRYGNRGDQYFSPMADLEKVKALYEKYRAKS